MPDPDATGPEGEHAPAADASAQPPPSAPPTPSALPRKWALSDIHAGLWVRRLAGPVLLVAGLGLMFWWVRAVLNALVAPVWLWGGWALVALVALLPRLQVAALFDEPEKWIDADNKARQTMVQLGVGVVVLAGAFNAYRQYVHQAAATQENLRLARESHHTEQINSAVEKLTSDRPEARIGAIYALERLARLSEEDQWSIAETLCAFVRERAKRTGDTDKPGPPPANPRWPDTYEPHPPPGDVQAALTVLGRNGWQPGAQKIVHGRDFEYYHHELDLTNADLRGADLTRFQSVPPSQYKAAPRQPVQRVNLSGSDLRRAIMTSAYLEHAGFVGARLDGAYMAYADLSEAEMRTASLAGACLYHARFTGADLSHADLRSALFDETDFNHADLPFSDFRGTDLSGALLARAHLREADFTDAILELDEVDVALSRVKGLTVKQLKDAKIDTTLWPPSLKGSTAPRP